MLWTAFILVAGVVLAGGCQKAADSGNEKNGDKTAPTADTGTEYFCPMHPQVVRDTNKETCPICNMPLSGRKKGATEPQPARTPSPAEGAEIEESIRENLGKLQPEDRALALGQGFCPVLEGSRLGSMGVPVKLTLDGKPVFVCCPACEPEAKKDPAKTAARAAELRGGWLPAREEEAKIRAALVKLPPADRKLAEAQKYCPVTGEQLGSLGVPLKLVVKGQPAFLCCKGCVAEAQKDSDKTLKALADAKAKSGLK
jgi:hypothetical protein